MSGFDSFAGFAAEASGSFGLGGVRRVRVSCRDEVRNSRRGVWWVSYGLAGAGVLCGQAVPGGVYVGPSNH